MTIEPYTLAQTRNIKLDSRELHQCTVNNQLRVDRSTQHNTYLVIIAVLRTARKTRTATHSVDRTSPVESPSVAKNSSATRQRHTVAACHMKKLHSRATPQASCSSCCRGTYTHSHMHDVIGTTHRPLYQQHAAVIMIVHVLKASACSTRKRVSISKR